MENKSASKPNERRQYPIQRFSIFLGKATENASKGLQVIRKLNKTFLSVDRLNNSALSRTIDTQISYEKLQMTKLLQDRAISRNPGELASDLAKTRLYRLGFDATFFLCKRFSAEFEVRVPEFCKMAL